MACPPLHEGSRPDVGHAAEVAPDATSSQAGGVHSNLDLHLHALLAIDCTPISRLSELEQVTRRNAEAVVWGACQLHRVESANGVYVVLPPPARNSVFLLPRSHPWPLARPTETRWQTFARAKGIVKRKRSRLVWSDVARDWVPRWGSRSSHALEEAAHVSSGVVEIPGESTFLGRVGRDRGIRKLGKCSKKVLREPTTSTQQVSSSYLQSASAAGRQPLDPFASRKLRSAKQKLRQVRTQLEAQAKGQRLSPGVLSVLGSGAGKKSGEMLSKTKQLAQKKNHRGQTREELKDVMRRAQASTASYGTYNRLAKNEKKERQKTSTKGKPASLKDEQGIYLKQLKQVLHKESAAA